MWPALRRSNLMTQDSSRLKDKVVIVTGGAKGIGRAYALGMASEGAKVVVADINIDKAEAMAKEIQENYGEALALKVDVTSVEDTQALAKKTSERFGSIDVLLNNAAMLLTVPISRVPFWEVDLAEWDRTVDVNLKGTFLCCRAVFPYMKAQGGGKIINISSSVAFLAVPNQLAYVASKAGVVGLTRAMAKEVGDYGINVNSIAPGATQSYDPVTEKENWEARENQMKQMVERQQIVKRIQRPEDLVGAAIFLASSESDTISGQTIVVDGGVAIH
jgi:3-oxoacyl-[acyl-carrier protein] reductase